MKQETIRIQTLAEAKGTALEAKLAEDVNRRLLVERANAEREKWISAINTTFEHIGGELRVIFTDQDKLVVAVGGVTALAAGVVYTTREGARVIWSYVDRILGQPSLIRESSRGRFPWSGGDVAPLGLQAVTKIHQLFDWAKKSNRGLLLFIDEADAFLCETGDQSKDIVIALATNRPGDLDSAVTDPIYEVLEFPLPGQSERFELLKLNMDRYIAQAGARKAGFFSRLRYPEGSRGKNGRLFG
ncbi:unnamed protein product [Cuscuta campestris]|uniref:ATPase family AAA domain-containing protein n=1 Tax=Cuscuta campestris TaxID=132261 RepID=A0A484L1S9_9ASTE|nr:unnamed protein product [Cuscuta campestris]